MKELLSILTLEPLRGKRTQITIVLMGVINTLVSLGWLQLTAEDLKRVNDFLTLAIGFFFADKVSK